MHMKLFCVFILLIQIPKFLNQRVRFQKMKEPITLRDISQIKKHTLHVCGQEHTILLKYLETFSLFLRPWDWGIFRHSTGCRVVFPAVPWRSLPCQCGQCTAHIIPLFLGVLIPNTQGCDCSDCLDPERYFAGFVGDEPHRSAKRLLHGAWDRGTHQRLLPLAAFAWWFMKWEGNSQPCTVACRAQGASRAGLHRLWSRNVDFVFKHLLYIKPPSLW